MSRVTIIGGMGYIGQRLALKLASREHEVAVVDPCAVSGVPNKILEHPMIQHVNCDVRSWEPEEDCGPIVYLASFHDCPFWDGLILEEKVRWEEAAREIMVDQPRRLADAGKEVIYVSSMRAVTHQHTFYGNLKAIAERELFQKAHIIRFGTVHGAMDRDLYNRTITVPNNYAVRDELPDGNWEAYTTKMGIGLAALFISAEKSYRGEVHNCTDFPRPCTYKDLPDLVPKAGYHPREEHPALATARYYDLPLPKETP
jgi:nucleoside-diphosphate-sugar epimerase